VSLGKTPALCVGQGNFLIEAVTPNARHHVCYKTGEIKIFNVLPYMSGKWYEELYDNNYFKTVHLISGGKGIEWEHGQDIAPHELYDMSIISHNR
jgi:hypothetical protein